MAKHNKKKTVTIAQFEHTAQELIHIMLTLCEERIFAAEKLDSPVGKTMADAAMSVKYAIKAFIAIERMHDK